MDYFLCPYQLFLQQYSEPQISSDLQSSQREKRGRKSLDSTIILSEFFGKSKKYPPRREYIRCCLFRKMFKFIKTTKKNKLETRSQVFHDELVQIIRENSKEIKKITDRDKLPFVENRTNLKFKSYNNKFCKQFLENDLIKKVFYLFVEYLFANYSLGELSKKLGIYCCKERCVDEFACRVRFEKIKFLILLDILN